MASSRILDSRYFDKLAANRLEALSIKSDNIKNGTSDSSGPDGPSYLFSLLLKDATFTPNTTGGTLTFDLPLHSGDNVIMFSDRPFRQTSFISFNEFISAFTSDNSNDSFQKDPPNAVLVHSEEQRTYIVRYSSTDSSSDSTTVTFNLELLAGETNVSLNVISGRMNLFVDDFNFGSLIGDFLLGGIFTDVNTAANDVAAFMTFTHLVNNITSDTDVTAINEAYKFYYSSGHQSYLVNTVSSSTIFTFFNYLDIPQKKSLIDVMSQNTINALFTTFVNNITSDTDVTAINEAYKFYYSSGHQSYLVNTVSSSTIFTFFNYLDIPQKKSLIDVMSQNTINALFTTFVNNININIQGKHDYLSLYIDNLIPAIPVIPASANNTFNANVETLTATYNFYNLLSTEHTNSLTSTKYKNTFNYIYNMLDNRTTDYKKTDFYKFKNSLTTFQKTWIITR